MQGEAAGWRERSRGGDALWDDVPHSAPEFLCITPSSRGTSLPRASASPAAEAAQRVKTVAADPDVLLPGRKRNRWVCQPGWELPCVVVQALAALRLSAKGTRAADPAAVSAWQVNLRLPVPKMMRVGERQQPWLVHLHTRKARLAKLAGHTGLRVAPGMEAPSRTEK